MTRAICWDLIAQQYDQMVKYATALRRATAEAEQVLRRFTPGAYLLAQVTGLPIVGAYQGVMAQGVGSWQWQATKRAVTSVLRDRRC